MHRPSVAGPLRAVLFQHKAVGTVVYQAYGLAARQLLFDAAVAPVILVAVGNDILCVEGNRIPRPKIYNGRGILWGLFK